MAENQSSWPQIMKINDVAHYLNVHTTTIYRLMKRHDLPGRKVGKNWRFWREDIDRWRFECEAARQAVEPKDAKVEASTD